MNTENLLKEIDSEKEKMASKIELSDTELLYEHYKKDSILLSPLLLVAIGIAFYTDIISKRYDTGCVITAIACVIIPMLPLLFNCFEKRI